jgi:hypothetical protein
MGYFVSKAGCREAQRSELAKNKGGALGVGSIREVIVQFERHHPSTN